MWCWHGGTRRMSIRRGRLRRRRKGDLATLYRGRDRKLRHVQFGVFTRADGDDFAPRGLSRGMGFDDVLTGIDRCRGSPERLADLDAITCDSYLGFGRDVQGETGQMRLERAGAFAADLLAILLPRAS